MKTWLLDYIQCLDCQGSLELETFNKDDSGLINGVLICQNDTCKKWFPVIRSVPRFLPKDLIKDEYHEFSMQYEDQLKKCSLNANSYTLTGDKLEDLKKQTIQNFGFEWVEYNRFGWDDPVYNNAFEEEVFHRKSLLNPDDLKKKVVLDAGCGNGRYCHWAAKNANHVIGVDLGDGVESANENTHKLANVQIIQGDIFNLPLKPKSLDAIYSIGVLMHTGNAHQATINLSKKLKERGTITIHLYGKGNFIYEFFDALIRKRTTKMSIERLQIFTKRMFRLRKILEKIFLVDFVNLFIKVDPHPHCIFDWYAAPIATHHTYSQVKTWFKDLEMPVLKTNEGVIVLGPRIKTKNNFKLSLIRSIKKIIYPIESIPVTVKAEKP